MNKNRKCSSSPDEKDNDGSKRLRDHGRSKYHEDSSRRRDFEASSEDRKMFEAVDQKMCVKGSKQHSKQKSDNWRVQRAAKPSRFVYLDPPARRTDQPSTSGTQRSSNTTRNPESRSSRPRIRASSIDDSRRLSNLYKVTERRSSTESGAHLRIPSRHYRRSPSPTRYKRNSSRDRSSQSYGRKVAHKEEQNILPGFQVLSYIPPQGNLLNRMPVPKASSFSNYFVPQYSEIHSTPASIKPYPTPSHHRYLYNQNTFAASFGVPNYATDQQPELGALRLNHGDRRILARMNRPRIFTEVKIEDVATLQAEISSTRSPTEPTPLQPEAPNVESTSASTESEIVDSTTQTSVSDV